MSLETFAAIRHDMHELMEKLRAERDELNLKLHLGKAEVHDELEKLEPKWEHFQSQVHAISDSAEEAGNDVRVGLSLLADELKAGFSKVRDKLGD